MLEKLQISFRPGATLLIAIVSLSSAWSYSAFASDSCAVARHEPGEFIKKEIHVTVSGKSNLPETPLMKAAAEKLNKIDSRIKFYRNDDALDDSIQRDGEYRLGRYPGNHAWGADDDVGSWKEYQRESEKAEERVESLRKNRKVYLKGLLKYCQKQNDQFCVKGKYWARHYLVSNCIWELQDDAVPEELAKNICGSAQFKTSGAGLLYENKKWSYQLTGELLYSYPVDPDQKVKCESYKKCENDILAKDDVDWTSLSRMSDKAKALEKSAGYDDGACHVALLIDGPGPLIQTASLVRGGGAAGPQSATQIHVRQQSLSSNRIRTAALVGADAFN